MIPSYRVHDGQESLRVGAKLFRATAAESKASLFVKKSGTLASLRPMRVRLWQRWGQCSAHNNSFLSLSLAS